MRSVNDVSELERLRRRVDEASDPHAASGLGWLLWQRRDGPDARETDLEEGVEAFALAMTVDVGTFPEQLLPRIAEAAAPFAAGLLERAATTADPRPLNLSVELWNRIASVQPGHAGHLSRLGIALRMQFDRTGDRERLALAVRAGETALVRADPDDPELPAMLHDVAVTLKTTYVHGGDRAELLRAVALLEEAVTVLPEDHPRRATYLSSLAAARRLRHDGPSVPSNSISPWSSAHSALPICSANSPPCRPGTRTPPPRSPTRRPRCAPGSTRPATPRISTAPSAPRAPR